MSKRTTDFLEELKTLLFKYDAEICTHDNTMIDVFIHISGDDVPCSIVEFSNGILNGYTTLRCLQRMNEPSS